MTEHEQEPSSSLLLPQPKNGENRQYSYVLYENLANRYFVPRLREGQLCWVLKSKGITKHAELFMRARVVSDSSSPNEMDRRVLVRYPKGSEYHVRRSNLLPVFEHHSSGGGGIVLVVRETPDYRRACVVHTVENDSFLEIGCDFGPTIDRVRTQCTTFCLGIDKSMSSIDIAQNRYPDCTFAVYDVLEEPMDKLAELCRQSMGGSCPSVVAIDINGNRELPAVLQCLERIVWSQSDHSDNWTLPRLIIVKSRSLYESIVQTSSVG